MTSSVKKENRERAINIHMKHDKKIDRQIDCKISLSRAIVLDYCLRVFVHTHERIDIVYIYACVYAISRRVCVCDYTAMLTRVCEHMRQHVCV